HLASRPSDKSLGYYRRPLQGSEIVAVPVTARRQESSKLELRTQNSGILALPADPPPRNIAAMDSCEQRDTISAMLWGGDGGGVSAQ
ncbi:MAG: hypothetical protein ACC645_04740, partial [Pirellulales bacterium]